MTSTSAPKKSAPAIALSAADARHFAVLETAFGDTLWAALRSYIENATAASLALQTAVECAHWQEAARLARKIGDGATDLDFRGVTEAARRFTASVYSPNTAHARRNIAQMLMLEFVRSVLIITSRYPGLMENGGRSGA